VHGHEAAVTRDHIIPDNFTDHRISGKRSIFADEVYSTSVKWVDNYFGL